MQEEKVWIQRTLAGDQEAFAYLVTAYQTAIYNLAYRMLGNAVEAEDAAQETFLKAYTRLNTYDSGRKFSSWLLSIASHHCIDRLRQRRFALSLDELPPWRWLSSSKRPEVAVVLMILLAITICLSPVAFLLGVAMLVAGLFGWIAIGLLVGQRLLEAFKVKGITSLMAVAAGTLLISVLRAIPCLGAIFGFVVGCVGLGAVVLTRFGRQTYPLASPVPPVPPMPPAPVQPEEFALGEAELKIEEVEPDVEEVQPEAGEIETEAKEDASPED